MLESLSKLDRLERSLSRWFPAEEPAAATAPADLERWRADPVAFAAEALGVELTDYQAEILRDLAAHHRVAVRSGHKVGKSRLDAVAALWWFCCVPDGCVVITAPTGRQVKRIVWRELCRLVIEARRLGRVDIPPAAKDPGTGIQHEDGRYIVGFSTDQPENMAGYSGPAMLFIGDEGSGIDEEIFEAIEGNTAGGEQDDPTAVAKVLLTGNPTQTSGTFFEAFHRQRSQWRCHHISSEDSPNVAAGRVVVRGLATRHYVESKRKSWGEDSDLYRVRVRGDFPRGGGDQVVPLELITAGRKRWGKTEPQGRLELGVDVARFGDDDSAIAPRRGRVIFPIVTRNGLDEHAVSAEVLRVCAEHRIKGEQRPLVKVDACGVGLGVASILRQARDECGDLVVDVLEVDSSKESDDEDEFFNTRTQLWFATAQFLREGGALPDDDELEEDLAAPKYGFDARSRRKVERKEDMKKRLGRSPDKGDAVALAIYSPATTGVGAKAGAPNPRWEGMRRGFG